MAESNPFAALVQSKAPPVAPEGPTQSLAMPGAERRTGKGMVLIPADEEATLRVLYFEKKCNARDLAARMSLTREQMSGWLNRKGWPAQRRAVIGLVSIQNERTVARLVNRHAADIERIEDLTVSEGRKEAETLARTRHPSKRLMHARTLSALLGAYRTAGGDQRTQGAGTFPFGFMAMLSPEPKAADVVSDSVSIPVSASELPR